MLPQVDVERPQTVVQSAPDTAKAPRELTEAERQGLAMSWVAIALGTFLLLGGLAMWAAIALNAGFGGWLIAIGIMGVVVIAAVAIAVYFLRPRRR